MTIALTTIDQMEYASDALARAAYGGNSPGWDSPDWLSGWNYRKSITLSCSSGAVTNYQMKLLVGESAGATGESVDCGAHCKTDFSDLRFTNSDGTTLLDYWIESVSGTTPNQLATVWIEFDSIGTTDTTFWMYYGNSGASAYSNGVNTFIFFDDFNDNALDTASRWSYWAESNTSYIESSQQLQVSVGATMGKVVNLRTQQSFSPSGKAFRVTMRNGAANNQEQILWISQDAADSNPWNQNNWYRVELVNAGDLCRVGKRINGGAQVYNAYSSSWISDTNTLEIRSPSEGKISFMEGLSVRYSEAYGLSGSNVYMYLNSSIGTTAGSGTDYFENAIIRNYQSTEPSWGAWGSESIYGAPVIYSESTIIQSGSYAIKGIAAQTTSLNKTLTRTLVTPIDLTGKANFIGYIRSSRTGSNIKIGLHDSGGTTTEITPNIANADTWQLIDLDISSVSDANKDAIDQVIITVVNADAENTFYLDNLFAVSDPQFAISKVVGYAVLSPIQLALNISKLVGYAVLGPGTPAANETRPIYWVF